MKSSSALLPKKSSAGRRGTPDYEFLSFRSWSTIKKKNQTCLKRIQHQLVTKYKEKHKELKEKI